MDSNLLWLADLTGMPVYDITEGYLLDLSRRWWPDCAWHLHVAYDKQHVAFVKATAGDRREDVMDAMLSAMRKAYERFGYETKFR